MPAYLFLSQLTTSYEKRGPTPSEIYEDPRNEHLLVWIGAPNRGRLLPRSMAGVSPWDSSVQGGDGCWEGIRGTSMLDDDDAYHADYFFMYDIADDAIFLFYADSSSLQRQDHVTRQASAKTLPICKGFGL